MRGRRISQFASKKQTCQNGAKLSEIIIRKVPVLPPLDSLWKMRWLLHFTLRTIKKTRRWLKLMEDISFTTVDLQSNASWQIWIFLKPQSQDDEPKAFIPERKSFGLHKNKPTISKFCFCWGDCWRLKPSTGIVAVERSRDETKWENSSGLRNFGPGLCKTAVSTVDYIQIFYSHDQTLRLNGRVCSCAILQRHCNWRFEIGPRWTVPRHSIEFIGKKREKREKKLFFLILVG